MILPVSLDGWKVNDNIATNPITQRTIPLTEHEKKLFNKMYLDINSMGIFKDEVLYPGRAEQSTSW